MRIMIVTAGSRGDVAPFTGLGARLQREGHQVSIAAHDRFGSLVRDCGFEHRSLPGDPVAMARARIDAPSPDAARSVFASYLDELGRGLIEATSVGTDLVVTAFGPAPLSRLVADGFGIPSIGAYLVPSVPTAAFPLPGSPDAGPAGNLASGQQMIDRTGLLFGEVLPALAARLGLPAAAGRVGAAPPDGWPIGHGFSPSVVPRPDDWPAAVQVTGYWWSARPVDWQPPADLLDFLQAGAAPVFIGFGSTTSATGGLSELVAAAVQQVGVRAVVQTGWAGLAPAGDDIHVVGDIPHDWLFERMAVVVHHGGAGTTAAALRAGVPSVAVPVTLDQPFWGARLHDLGVGPRPLPQAELTVDGLAATLRACVDHTPYRVRAEELARQIATEDGAGAMLDLIDDLTG